MAGVAQPGIVGAREDLTDTIFKYKAELTPYLSMAKKGPPPTNETHEHQADKPATVARRGKKDNTPSPDATNMTKDRRKIQTYNHWIDVMVSVGKKAEKITNVAGIGKGRLMATEVAKGLKAIKTGVDRTLCDYSDLRAESGSVGSETRGAFEFIKATAQSTLPVDAKYLSDTEMIYAGTKANFTEDTLRDMAAHQFTLRDEDTRLQLVVGINLKKHISDWSIKENNVSGKTLLRQVNRNMKDRVLSAVVDIIEADGCTYEILPSNNLYWDRTSTSDTMSSASKWAGLILDSSSCEVGFAQGFEVEDLPKDGGGERKHIDVIFYHAMTPKVNGKINPSDA